MLKPPKPAFADFAPDLRQGGTGALARGGARGAASSRSQGLGRRASGRPDVRRPAWAGCDRSGILAGSFRDPSGKLAGSWPEAGGKLAGSWREAGRILAGRFEDGSRTIRGRRGGGRAVRPGRRPRRWRGARRGASASGGGGAGSWRDPGRNLAGRFGDDSRTIRGRFEGVGAAEERVGGAVPAAAPLPIDGVLLPDFSPSVKRAEWAPSVFSHPAGLASGFVAYFFASARSPAWNQR